VRDVVELMSPHLYCELYTKGIDVYIVTKHMNRH